MTDAEAQRLILQRLYDIRHSNPNATPEVFQGLKLGDGVLFGILDQLAQLGLISWRPHQSARSGRIDSFANARITALGVRSIEQGMLTNAGATQNLTTAQNLTVDTTVIRAPSSAQTTFQFNLSDRPGDIKDAARLLAAATDKQIEKLQSSKPNSQDELARHNEYVGFLQKLADGLRTLADALDPVADAKEKGEPLFTGEAAKIAAHLSTDVIGWLRRHHADIVDFTMMIGFVAAGYNLLHVCGVEGVTASVVSGLLATSFPKKTK